MFSFDWKDCEIEDGEDYELLSLSNRWMVLKNNHNMQCDITFSPKWPVLARYSLAPSSVHSDDDELNKTINNGTFFTDTLHIKMNYNDRDWIEDCVDNSDWRIVVWGKRYIKDLLFHYANF
jgi:hypothetical protein